MKANEIYKCAHCGAIVEVVSAVGGKLICCGQPMTLLTENTVEAAKEKHVPVVEVQSDGILVKVGSVAHPMDPDHFIEWIEVIAGHRILRHQLKPSESPQAKFDLKSTEGLVARAYCNKHGLWKN